MAKKRKKGRKRPRSAKQKAVTRKLASSNRKRSKPRRKSTSKRKSKAKSRRKNKSTKSRKKTVVKKGIGKVFSNPILRKVLLAAGVVSVATSVAAIVAPSLVPTLQRPIVRAGLGFISGDFVGAISNFVIGGGGLNSLVRVGLHEFSERSY